MSTTEMTIETFMATEPQTIDEARLQLAHDLHTAVHGDTWARSSTPSDVWRELIATVEAWRRDRQDDPRPRLEETTA